MATFKGAVLVCQICGAKFKVPSCRATTATTCSHACSVKYRAAAISKEKAVMICECCGITYMVHQSYTPGRKYCSNKCKKLCAGQVSKALGLSRGDRNGQWKGGTTAHSDGYVYEKSYSHPLASNGYVFQHRLVVERHLLETNPKSPCLVKLGENYYLNPELVVHHKNLDRKDNRVENLQVMTNGDHQGLHNRLRSKQ